MAMAHTHSSPISSVLHSCGTPSGFTEHVMAEHRAGGVCVGVNTWKQAEMTLPCDWEVAARQPFSPK